MSVGVLSFLLALALPAVWIALAYNRLVELRNAVRNAFSQIDVQLKRRHDLVPALVDAARAHRLHERQLIDAVVAARQGASSARASAAALGADARSVARLDSAERSLSTGLGRLIALAESYPELQADATISRLGEQLAGTEHRIAFARGLYNDSVTDYNDAVGRFPTNLVAAAFAFRRGALLQATSSRAEREPVAATA